MPIQHHPEMDRYLIWELPHLAGKRVLDLGCGEGAIGFLLRRHQGGRDAYIVGVDIHDPYLEWARDLNVYDALVRADIATFAFRGCDVVVASEVIEHLPRPAGEALLDRLDRCGAPTIIVTTPNGNDLRTHEVGSESHISCWTPGDFKRRGYTVLGLGSRRWRQTDPVGRWGLAAWYWTTPFARKIPVLADSLLAVKKKGR